MKGRINCNLKIVCEEEIYWKATTTIIISNIIMRHQDDVSKFSPRMDNKEGTQQPTAKYYSTQCNNIIIKYIHPSLGRQPGRESVPGWLQGAEEKSPYNPCNRLITCRFHQRN